MFLRESALVILAAVAATACNREGPDGAPPSEQEMAAIVAPEKGAAREDYLTATRSYRVLGVQGIGEKRGAFAVVADTTTWQTKELRAGDTVGRNFKVASVDANGVVVEGSQGAVHMPVGQDTLLKEVVYKADDAVRYVGKNRYRVERSKLSTAITAPQDAPVGALAERADVFGSPSARVVSVDRGTVLDRLGFRAGDLILSVDGVPVSDADGTLRTIQARAVDLSTGELRVRVFRGNAFRDLVFDGR